MIEPGSRRLFSPPPANTAPVAAARGGAELHGYYTKPAGEVSAFPWPRTIHQTIWSQERKTS